MLETGTKIRIGISGFGKIGRQIFQVADQGDDFEVVAISDIGDPKILLYLLNSEFKSSADCQLDNNYLVSEYSRSRMLQGGTPGQVPWDAYDVDFVIEATGKFNSQVDMLHHINAGARRVLLSGLPATDIDRVVIAGINESSVRTCDKVISAGSSTATALAVLLKAVGDRLPIDYASVTSIHAYTSDQSLQDYAGKYIRRSRSAAQNIIPNTIDACTWVEKLLPQFENRLSGYALNVPVQKGSMLDLNVVFKEEDIDVDGVNRVVRAASLESNGLLGVTDDPIVSSDVIGSANSLLFDTQATIKAGARMVKLVGWYESLGQAHRILDIARIYNDLDRKEISA